MSAAERSPHSSRTTRPQISLSCLVPAMAPRLVEEGKIQIQILGQTADSVVYTVANESKTRYTKDSLSILKGGTVCVNSSRPLGCPRSRRPTCVPQSSPGSDRLVGLC
ncbi:hypothetical protein B0T24DRAFT_638858 [Lasiosphaeria ovina]|uniref:Uncharacterized protein n=1 Tax=Lasiosphaeria ovina TaxID=92902 RepID=A0AAE0JVA1_9PEZI|nr:hypothetical protein B0T24DRAFT_638858 [Lasiosphaeria ovina]